MQTNKGEATEFLSTYVFSIDNAVYLFSFLLMCSLAAGVERLYAKYRVAFLENAHLRFYIGSVSVVCLLLAMPLLYSYSFVFSVRDTDALNEGIATKAVCKKDPISLMVYAMASLHTEKIELARVAQRCKEASSQCSYIADDDSLIVVFVLGESYIKRHAGSYGYSLPTDVRMQQEQKQGRLLFFSDVVSPYHTTCYVMKHLFCLNSIAAGEKWYDYPIFTVLFKGAGYDVSYWDGQRMFDNKNQWKLADDAFFYNPVVDSLSYSVTNSRSFTYDGELIQDYISQKVSNKPRKFIMFHLLAQHQSFKDRFPHTPAFERFKPADVPNRQPWMTPEKRQAVADYDNATLYNDSVMGMLFQHFRHDNAVLVYLSDHGEEVYDAHDNMGRRCNPADPASLRLQHEVPFVLWMSDTYRQRHPEVVARARAAQHRPYMTDNVGHLLLGLAGIRTPYYIKERDLLSPAFRPQRRLLHGTDDYDQLCGGQ